ncbi:hypothetical protein KQX54_006247 [Cotesia glomerata]|uniref:BEN domain-containing protein n=3 Tax=Cotesia glomerata TaxID=32391 RepID=A0AAV7ISB7_COTGL|nr:hypothetical protein KQX54_006247 [Cotesia glomerata]
MYSLVIWSKSRSSSIIETKNTKIHKKKGFMAKKDKQFEQAELIKKSNYKKVLEKVDLDSDGKIVKKPKKKNDKNTIEADKNLVGSKSIFEKFGPVDQELTNSPSENGTQQIVVEAVIEHEPSVSAGVKNVLQKSKYEKNIKCDSLPLMKKSNDENFDIIESIQTVDLSSTDDTSINKPKRIRWRDNGVIKNKITIKSQDTIVSEIRGDPKDSQKTKIDEVKDSVEKIEKKSIPTETNSHFKPKTDSKCHKKSYLNSKKDLVVENNKSNVYPSSFKTGDQENPEHIKEGDAFSDKNDIIEQNNKLDSLLSSSDSEDEPSPEKSVIVDDTSVVRKRRKRVIPISSSDSEDEPNSVNIEAAPGGSKNYNRKGNSKSKIMHKKSNREPEKLNYPDIYSDTASNDSSKRQEEIINDKTRVSEKCNGSFLAERLLYLKDNTGKENKPLRARKGRSSESFIENVIAHGPTILDHNDLSRSSLIITQDNIDFLENLLQYVKCLYEKQTTEPATLPSVSRRNDCDNRESKFKVELIPKSKIWVSASFLEIMSNTYKSKPSRLVIKLLHYIIGEKNLANMTLTGGKGTKKIPKKTVKAIREYVHWNTRRKLRLDLGDFNRVITNACYAARIKFKNEKKKEITRRGILQEGNMTEKDQKDNQEAEKGTAVTKKKMVLKDFVKKNRKQK